ncbi:facilitated trehalose transporter Tret1 [Diabrotica virgifera virgifera]|uniref:Major facilitator superfamily (MFS) profile domain-containing protein n=1 Tax=Diabrotica virgifera virgifera TaxID=50390 RepID=A0ABM5INX1_DIAVI|nr:facilitated trehalose transporter Tret1 [Diabrotica virgifera virgifera]
MSAHEMYAQPYKMSTSDSTVYKPLVKDIPPEIGHSQNGPKTTWFLYFAAITSNLAQLTIGLMGAWMSPVSEQILSTNMDVNPLGKPVTILQLSLIGASQATGSVIGPLLIGKCYDIFGRKPTLLYLCLTMTTSLILLSFSSTIYLYIPLLFIAGVCNGAMNVGLTVYVGEITEDHNRGRFICLVQVGVPIGMMLSFLTGPYLSVKYYTLICAIPVALNAIFFATILPESPIQLVKFKLLRQAQDVLGRLRQKSPKEVEIEVTRIQNELAITSNNKQGGCFKLLSDKSSRNGFIVAVVTYNMLVLSGSQSMTSYLEPIFDKAESPIPSNICALLVTIVQIFCYLGSSVFVEKVGKRNLILFSTSTSIIPLILFGLYFQLKYSGFTFVEQHTWFPIVALVVFTLVNNIGNASVPAALMNDLFSNQMKATAVATTVLSSGILNSIVTFGIPLVMETVGIQWCFWIFAGNCVLGTIFVYFLVPETINMTIAEIQDILRNLI